MPASRPIHRLAALLPLLAAALPGVAETNLPAEVVAAVTNAAAPTVAATNAVIVGGSLTPPPAFDAGASFVRLIGAMLLVLALFFGAVWVYRNWQRVMLRQNPGVRLDVKEVRSLGNRQSLVIVGYGSQRMLLGATPAGISLLSHLPAEDQPAETAPPPTSGATRPPSFMEALNQVISRKAS